MADRETLMDALIRLECEETTYWRELTKKQWREALTTAEFDLPIESRQARRECGYYDELFTEMHDERNAEKERVRNRRINNRKHPDNKAERKANRMKRITRLHGEMFEDRIVATSGWAGMPGVYALSVWIRDERNGAKQTPEKDAEIIRNLREKSAEEGRRADFKAEIAMHEERMAEYHDHMYWYDRFTSDAENMLDEEIDGKWTTPEKVMDAINGFRMLAEDEKKYAQEILKGEMYK